MCQLSRWLQLASEVGTKAGVFAAFGQSWNYESFQALMQSHGFRKTYHRACHFGLKLDPQQEVPSKICFVFLGNKDVSPHPCKCKTSQNEHVLDWKNAGSSISRRPRLKLQHEVAKAKHGERFAVCRQSQNNP